MRQIPYTVQCDLPGFETFAVSYNVWASQEDVEELTDSIGEPVSVDRSAVIMDISGWPEDSYPARPFSKKATFLISICVFRDAIRNVLL